jgi:hypothetical protein
VIHSLRRKPMALMGLVYRDSLFPREAYRRMFEHLLEHEGEHAACRMTVDLLAMAHERACEAELAGLLEADLAARRCPDIAALRSRFSPDPEQLPQVDVKLGRLASYDSLIGWGEAA